MIGSTLGTFHRRAALFTALVAGVVAMLGSVGWTADTPARAAPTQSGGTPVQLELIEEQYAFGPDAPLHLVYRLTGDLPALGLEPPPPETTVAATTVPETTTPDSTTPETTTPETTTPGDTVPGDTVSPTDSATTVPTTTVPVVPVLPLTVEVTNYPPLLIASDLDDLVGGDVDRDTFGSDAVDGVQLVDVRNSITVAEDGTATLTLDVPTDVDNSVEERLKFDRPGLYPIRTELLAGDPDSAIVVATHGTIVQRLPGRNDPATIAPPINLTVMTAIGAATAETTNAEQAAKAETFDETVDMASALDNPVTMEVPPPLVAAEASTAAGRDHMASSLAGDTFVAVPAMPLDVSSAAAAGKTDEFARQLRLGEDMLSAAVPTASSSRNAWIATDPLSGPGAQELRDLGFRYLVMTERLYRDTVDPTRPQTDLFVEALLPGGDTVPLIVVDPLSEQFTAENTDAVLQESTPAEWAVRTITEMLVDQASDDPDLQRSRVLSTPDLAPPDPRLLVGLETLVTTTPSVVFTDAATLTGRTDVQTLAGQPVQVELPAEAGPSLTQRVAAIDATALSAASAGTMLPTDDPRPASWALQLGALISTAVSDEQVLEVTSGIQSEADAIRGSVTPPDPFTFTLTGRSGDIEIQLANTSSDPLTVILRASSPKLSFPDSTTPVVGPPDADAGDHLFTLRPNDEQSVIIPVRAKSNGTSPITVQLLTPAGEEIDEPVTITATVTAFTGLGQVLTAGLVLVLLTWWATHWRSRRRAALSEVRERHPSGAK